MATYEYTGFASSPTNTKCTFDNTVIMSMENFPTPENNTIFDCGHKDGTALDAIMLSLWERIIDGRQSLWLEAEKVTPATLRKASVKTTVRGFIVGAERHYRDTVLEVAYLQKTYHEPNDPEGTYRPTFIRMTHFEAQKNCPGLMLLPDTYSETRSVDTEVEDYTGSCLALDVVSVYVFPSSTYSFKNFFKSREFENRELVMKYHEIRNITGAMSHLFNACRIHGMEVQNRQAECFHAKSRYEAAKGDLQECKRRTRGTRVN
ncbi:hypothetical protein CYMTET_38645 [Cymbomonas tetramitiformis]|uniref:Uncharacterized protein n=1 Tax=Cymbomonas tetramitiformis TaxID=36881 RepID=A0AAE0CDY5_9CHLO|nr:hypothetical protein CYMTET_44300 [Cymbomonas tetramitiformis]KAK3252087.1 hypothetical protein CYMTET_38645 [Cymbomonas tetramitiformis]